MNLKRAVMMAVLAVAIAALAVPIVGLRARAASNSTAPTVAAKAAAVPGASAATYQEARTGQRSDQPRRPDAGALGPISPLAKDALGVPRAKGKDISGKIAEAIKKRNVGGAGIAPQSGEPTILNATSALSAALMTNIGGRDNQFSEVTLLADWDGREDCVADRSAKVDDFSPTEPDIDFTLTRTAISEHTIANGFAENIFYYGDSVGNVWIGADTDGNGSADNIFQINIPTQLNAFGTVLSDDQITITGLAVNPVADLTSFPNVNGSYTPFVDQIGEILYVTYNDTESGLRLAPPNNTPVRSALLAFPIADIISGAPAAPGTIAPAGFPVTVGAAFGVAFSVFSNVAGCSVDDDGSIYFQQVDLVQFTGANIVKCTDIGANQDRSAATNGFLTFTTLNPTNGLYGDASGPAAQVNRFTNYSGTATTFGNIVALASGNCNVLYAAVSRSSVATDDAATQVTEGLFANPSALGATPSMVISFADCAGAFDTCTAPATGLAGTLPVANGIADVAQAGLTLAAGVNNFRVFVIGNGPDIRPPTGGTAVVPGTPSTLLKIDMQIDFSAHNGIAVSEEGTVFVISGGSPGGPGKNPSPATGEILCFEDSCVMDRRADFVDLRGNALPNPPASGGNVGDGDSDRFDHIFFVSPIDQVTLTPAGLAGLARGFLRYTNRLAPVGFGDPTLGVTARTQGDDSTSGPIVFEQLDPGHQVAGGDDQNSPFRGDDDNGLSVPNTASNPPVVGPLSGGFEFLFGATGSPATSCTNNVWNALFLNSNGNVTFNGGDTSNTPNVVDFRTGLPKIAPAWTDLNPNSRPLPASTAGVPNPGANTFPVQALGFANVNAFKLRWINVPLFGGEACGSRNTFAVTLYDDGTGIDENASQPLNPANPIGNNAVPFDLQEGPTDLRFALEPTTGFVIPCPSRPNGTGHFVFEYCRMDLLGTDVQPVLVGYSIGALNPLNPPGLCETNLSTAAVRADTGPFGVIDGQTATIMPCLIGEGTEPTIFELFNSGSGPRLGGGGEPTFATPDFDLRFEGNDPALCTPIRQRDLNRGKVGFYGLTCPVNPQCLAVTPVGTIAVAPGQPAVGTAAASSILNGAGARVATPTSGIINAVCTFQLNFLGCGFFPNETTTICTGFSAETGVPLQRPGKIVSSALAIICDTNGDGVTDLTIPLTAVNPINKNLVRGTVDAISAAQLPGTGFPLTCCGGVAAVTLTTSFTPGDNNIFGLFNRTTTCFIDLGVRAPVVISVTPSRGNCGICQDLLISGACFVLPSTTIGAGSTTNVTSVFAVDIANPATVIQATNFTVLNPNLVDALFCFGSANNGKRFLIFVTGPNGTSQNLTTLPAGANCPAGFLGNQQGVQVTFTCEVVGPPPPCTPGTPGCPTVPTPAVVARCQLDRSAGGAFILTIFGEKFKDNSVVTISGVQPKSVKFKSAESDPTFFTRITAKGKICGNIPGNIVVTNPGALPSNSFNCTLRCPTTE